MESIFIGYSEPVQIFMYMFYPDPIECNTLHCFSMNNTKIFEMNFLQDYVKKYQINCLFTLASHIFVKNTFDGLNIFHIRAIGDSNDEGIKNQIKNGCRYTNILASSEYLMEMISVVEKDNLEGFGWFNVIKCNYRLDPTNNELSILINEK
jgi:hypothetical protein